MAAHAEDFQKHVRIYISVFAALAALTVVTVGIAYVHLPTPAAVALAMVVAVTKGSLVALFFMHLSDEVSTIYRVLALTVVFFFVLMALPVSWYTDEMKTGFVWDQPVPASRAADAHGGHGGGHGDGH